jgi:hypothetical protein
MPRSRPGLDAVLYQLRYGEPGMRALAKANRRRRRRELTDEEAERIAAADRERDADDYDRGRCKLRSTRKAFTMRSETLRRIVKDAGGITSLCRRIVKDGSAGDVTEHLDGIDRPGRQGGAAGPIGRASVLENVL